MGATFRVTGSWAFLTRLLEETAFVVVGTAVEEALTVAGSWAFLTRLLAGTAVEEALTAAGSRAFLTRLLEETALVVVGSAAVEVEAFVTEFVTVLELVVLELVGTAVEAAD